MGRTMGSAELGRELGDAGGPLLVAGVATVSTLTTGYGALAILLAAGPLLALALRHRAEPKEPAESAGQQIRTPVGASETPPPAPWPEPGGLRNREPAPARAGTGRSTGLRSARGFRSPGCRPRASRTAGRACAGWGRPAGRR